MSQADVILIVFFFAILGGLLGTFLLYCALIMSSRDDDHMNRD